MSVPTTVVTGKIIDIFDAEIVGNNFEKRLFYVEEVGSKYPNIWQLELQQGKCNELDMYQVGNQIIAQVEIRGRKWVSREGREIIFTTLKVNDLQLANAPSNNVPKAAPTPPPPPPPPPAPTYPLRDENGKVIPDNPEDDLPF